MAEDQGHCDVTKPVIAHSSVIHMLTMMFYIQKVKVQLHCDIIMFCKTSLLFSLFSAKTRVFHHKYDVSLNKHDYKLQFDCLVEVHNCKSVIIILKRILSRRHIVYFTAKDRLAVVQNIFEHILLL